MRHLLSTTLFVLATSLLASSPRAQICAPTPPPSGQPALMPFTPACGGLLPPPVVRTSSLLLRICGSLF